jgi:hypothetical protein
MPNTSNFNWPTPADTDLVKDGAAAIRNLGNGVDTSFLDLKGGTTDQVLAKNSNTDLDFKWVAQDDSNAIQNAIVDAKGDLISATAADTPARLAVGANGTVLTADSAETTGLKWAAPAAGGKVLQVVYGTYDTPTTVASGTFTDTGLTLSITPTSATSKVYILATQNGRVSRLSNEQIAAFRILRGATVVFSTDTSPGTSGYTGMGGGGSGLTTFLFVNHIPLQYLDSPATTSSTAYKVQTKVAITANTGEITCQYENAKSAITLIEVGA